jgi:hypothetical protein
MTTCIVIIFEIVDLYPQYVNIKVNALYESAKNAFRQHMYCLH